MKHLLYFAALLLAPLLPGVINQTKAFFAGRKGPGVFRLYADLLKLLRKSCPRSATTTWIFDVAPALGLAATLAAGWVFPSDASDAVLFFYLLGLGRFFTVLGALDTGSAFEGMGASREVQFSALVEPTVFIVLGFFALSVGSAPFAHPVSALLIAIAFFAVLLTETCRVPFDDPETHLELTMIHEAMILDNAGPDLAFILYASAVKFTLLAAFLVQLVLPRAWLLPGVLAIALLVGVVESVIARMRFLKTPQVLLATLMLAALGTLLFIQY